MAGRPAWRLPRISGEAYPTRDAPAIWRLRAAGAVPLGPTNLANLAIRWLCVSESWGATINPWDPS
ncbi:amidase family protein [Arthrobacter sp. SLBN-100]|uniref:amidase family protein n=1 Tax=Arthrobacter sp. SLBN-100 TaxID=2768450 RepID=UPI001359F0EA